MPHLHVLFHFMHLRNRFMKDEKAGLREVEKTAGTHVRIWARICSSPKFPRNNRPEMRPGGLWRSNSEPWDLAVPWRSSGVLAAHFTSLALGFPLLLNGTALLHGTCSGVLPPPYRQRHHQMWTSGETRRWDLPIRMYVRVWLLQLPSRQSVNTGSVNTLLGKCVEGMCWGMPSPRPLPS